jgi:hypothetical protein
VWEICHKVGNKDGFSNLLYLCWLLSEIQTFLRGYLQENILNHKFIPKLNTGYQNDQILIDKRFSR